MVYKAFNSDGFTLGSEGEMNAIVLIQLLHHGIGKQMEQLALVILDGSGTYKTYSYSVNATAGFSIVKYTGTWNYWSATIPHHLGSCSKNGNNKKD